MAEVASSIDGNLEKIVTTFVNDYYGLLRSSPELVCRFFEDSSVLTHTELDGTITTVTTLQGINEKIQSKGGRNYFWEVRSAIVQKMRGTLMNGRIIVTYGSVTGPDGICRRFIQSFLLVLGEKDNDCVVLNDILCVHDVNKPVHIKKEETYDPSLINIVSSSSEVSGMSQITTFVNDYYGLLRSSPDQVGRFYQDSSVISHTDIKGMITTVTTLQAINEKIQSQGGTKYYWETRSAIVRRVRDTSMNGFFIVAGGCVSGPDRVCRRFTQTFFLVPQENNGCVVLNDILCVDIIDKAIHIKRSEQVYRPSMYILGHFEWKPLQQQEV